MIVRKYIFQSRETGGENFKVACLETGQNLDPRNFTILQTEQCYMRAKAKARAYYDSLP